MKLGFTAKCVVVIIAAATFNTGFAQNVLEAVTVTARKRAENLQYVPISVLAFTRA